MADAAYVTQAELEKQFTVERVAEVFSVQDSSGVTTGTADAAALAEGIDQGSAEAEGILIGAYGSSMPLATPYPRRLKHLVGVLVMHAGMLRRPEFQGDPERSPYYKAWKQARIDLDEIKRAMQRLSKEIVPGNVGVRVRRSTPSSFNGGYFAPDPATKKGGFNDGDF